MASSSFVSTSRRGSPSPSAGYLNEQSALTVEACLDALCFDQSHVVLDDCTVAPRETIPRLESLRADQEQRVRRVYGPQKLSPEALAEHLEDLYKADAISLQQERLPNEPSVIDALTDVTARIFKKEMKQRIHDWEGAFRDQYGRDPAAQDKMRLRVIYELYKAVKARVTDGPGGSGGLEATTRSEQPTLSSTARQPSVSSAGGGGGGGSTTRSNNNTTTSASTQPASLSGTTGSINLRPSVTAGVAVPPAPSGSSGGGAGGANQPRSSGALEAVARTSTTDTQLPSAATSAEGLSVTGTMSVDAGRPTGVASTVAAVAEKKALKRKLHAFEEDFRQQYNRAPSKEDRRPYQREYQRYGELKAYLAASGAA